MTHINTSFTRTTNTNTLLSHYNNILTISSGLSERIERALTQNIKIHDIKQQTDEYIKYIVSGTSSNYTATITNELKCTCPDFKCRRYLCKHILYILINKYSISIDNELLHKLVWPKADCRKYFNLFVINQTVKCKPYNNNDECGICYRVLIDDTINNNKDTQSQQQLTYCSVGCGNVIHKQCIDEWLTNNNTCIYCRCEFIHGNGIIANNDIIKQENDTTALSTTTSMQHTQSNNNNITTTTKRRKRKTTNNDNNIDTITTVTVSHTTDTSATTATTQSTTSKRSKRRKHNS